jgi:hypothetical protein
LDVPEGLDQTGVIILQGTNNFQGRWKKNKGSVLTEPLFLRTLSANDPVDRAENNDGKRNVESEIHDYLLPCKRSV